jgi:adenylate cyclase
MKNILYFLFFISSLSLSAQVERDSLSAVWNNFEAPDSGRMRALLVLVRDYYSEENPDTAVGFCEEIVEMARRNDNKMIEALASIQLADAIKYTRTNMEKGRTYLQNALKLGLEMQDSVILELTYYNLGVSYYFDSDMINAYSSIRKALLISEGMGEKSRQYEGILVNLGNIFSALGNFKKAEQYFVKALAFCDSVDPKPTCYILFGNLANAYLSKGDTIKGLEYYRKSAKVLAIDPNSYGYSQLNLAALLGQLGRFDESLVHVQELKKLASELNSNLFLAGYYLYGAPIKAAAGKEQEALIDLEKSMDIFQAMGVIEGEQEVLEFQYQIYRKLNWYKEVVQVDDERKRLEKKLNTGGKSIEIQRKEFQAQILADSLVVVEETRKMQLSHENLLRDKEKKNTIAYVVGALIFLFAIAIYRRLLFVRRSKLVLQKEKDRSESLLLNILPADIAAELKEKGKADARDFDLVSILFTDFKGFTEKSAKLSATELVAEINICFEAFDGIMEKYGIEKIKTIGDAYMAAGGLPVPTDDAVKNTLLAALEMQDFITSRKATMDEAGNPAFEMRVGIHTGPVVAGIVGVKKFQYDIWGDTVNTASRMESAGEVGKVNISQATYELLKDDPDFSFESRGKIEAKGKGLLNMYFSSKS